MLTMRASARPRAAINAQKSPMIMMILPNRSSGSNSRLRRSSSAKGDSFRDVSSIYNFIIGKIKSATQDSQSSAGEFSVAKKMLGRGSFTRLRCLIH